MPGKVNPTQCEALTMLSVQVIANDFAVTLGGGSGYLEMNVYKPLMIFNILKSLRLLQDGCHNFRFFLIEGMEPNHTKSAPKKRVIENLSNFVETLQATSLR